MFGFRKKEQKVSRVVTPQDLHESTHALVHNCSLEELNYLETIVDAHIPQPPRDLTFDEAVTLFKSGVEISSATVEYIKRSIETRKRMLSCEERRKKIELENKENDKRVFDAFRASGFQALICRAKSLDNRLNAMRDTKTKWPLNLPLTIGCTLEMQQKNTVLKQVFDGFTLEYTSEFIELTDFTFDLSVAHFITPEDLKRLQPFLTVLRETDYSSEDHPLYPLVESFVEDVMKLQQDLAAYLVANELEEEEIAQFADPNYVLPQKMPE